MLFVEQHLHARLLHELLGKRHLSGFGARLQLRREVHDVAEIVDVCVEADGAARIGKSNTDGQVMRSRPVSDKQALSRTFARNWLPRFEACGR